MSVPRTAAVFLILTGGAIAQTAQPGAEPEGARQTNSRPRPSNKARSAYLADGFNTNPVGGFASLT